MRLRDLGGIIVIDFIDMDERKNRAKVVQALEEALRPDRAPTKVISFNDFGLVAVTRKRVKQSLERTLCEPCDYCTGSGWVKSVNTVCNEILAEARKMAKQIDGNVITLRVNPEVAKALKSREGGAGLRARIAHQERRHHQERSHRPPGTVRDLLASGNRNPRHAHDRLAQSAALRFSDLWPWPSSRLHWIDRSWAWTRGLVRFKDWAFSGSLLEFHQGCFLRHTGAGRSLRVRARIRRAIATAQRAS